MPLLTGLHFSIGHRNCQKVLSEWDIRKDGKWCPCPHTPRRRGVEMLLGSCGWRPEMLPSALQCTGQHSPANKELPSPECLVEVKLRIRGRRGWVVGRPFRKLWQWSCLVYGLGIEERGGSERGNNIKRLL